MNKKASYRPGRRPQQRRRRINTDLPYRPGVGMTIFNRHGLVFVGERIDNPGAWQMPQGGIDEGEAPEIAVFREMEEEIGTRNARILGMLEEWIYYEIPERTAKKLWQGKYCGQRQKWIALEFLGEDSEIDLEYFSHPEFGQWKWVSIDDLLDHVVPFKRDVYRTVMEEFRKYAEALKKNTSA